MPIIQEGNSILTLINTFEVEQDKCDALLAHLIDATKSVMCGVDGFISASFHKSPDNKHIANYAQWESMEKFEAMLENPAATEHMEKAARMCINFSPLKYEVVFTEDK